MKRFWAGLTAWFHGVGCAATPQILTAKYWRCRFERNTQNPANHLLIDTPLVLFQIAKWGCTYLAFLRGGTHGGFLINFTWYRGTLAIIFVYNCWIWQHPQWPEFDSEIRTYLHRRWLSIYGEPIGAPE